MQEFLTVVIKNKTIDDSYTNTWLCECLNFWKLTNMHLFNTSTFKLQISINSHISINGNSTKSCVKNYF